MKVIAGIVLFVLFCFVVVTGWGLGALLFACGIGSLGANKATKFLGS